MKTWLLTGTPENWERSLDATTWGVTDKLKGRWDNLQKGDLLVLYCTAPVRGIVGLARANNKFKQDRPYWREEIAQGKVIWPLRFDYTPLYVLPKDLWTEKAIRPKLGKRTIAGMTPIHDESLVQQILDDAKERWKAELLEPERRVQKPEGLPYHREMKNLLLELGALSGFVVDQEYQLPDLRERLDVVWRRVAASVPTYAFEVHMEGSLHQALTKLKHAFDIWNSNIYLVVKDDEKDKVAKYLEGAFHEIRERMRFITVSELRQLHQLQTQDHQLKTKLGLK